MPSPNTKQLTLFNALHKSRTEDFKIFNKSSYRAVWSSIVDKYPETAHFIYELLQNADDAEATTVSIILRDTELIFKHNGKKHFDITEENAEFVGDINSITGIGDSTKANNQNKIGKFGVGFKAVFQYTDAPEIYDDIFKFKIENYIIPTLLNSDHPERKRGETLFVFPLNKNTANSYKDIKERLEGLHNPILFLRNLEMITWQIERSGKILNNGKYKKKCLEYEDISEFIKLEKIRLYDNDQASTIFLFSEDIIVNVDNSEHKICVGFYYDEVKKRLVTQNRQNMYCFFPTKEALDTCFIVHAPFLLTDNRQNLKPNESLNKSLIDLLAKLASNAILYLRDYGVKTKHHLIDKNIVKFIPEVKEDYWGNVLQPLLEPFHDAIIDVICSEEVLLSRNNNYISCDNAIIAEFPEMLKLISQKDFGLLQKFDEDDDDLDKKEFLKRDVSDAIQECENECFSDIETYTIDDFLNDIDSDFLDTKDSEWVVKLYAFLKKNIRLSHWKPNLTLSMFDNTSRRLYKAPIIHTKSNEWVSFLNKDSLPQVFFAPKNSRGLKYSFVDKEYVKIEEAKEFLEYLGVKEPDEKDFIYSQILPKYEGDSILGDEEEIVADFERLLSYYSKIKTSGDDLSFIQILKEKYYIKDDEDNNFNLAKHLYFKSDFLDDYFHGDYSWVDYEYYQQVIDKYGPDIVNSFLKELGVKSGPQIIEVTRYTDYYLNKGALECLKNISTSSLHVPDHYLESFYRACNDKYITLNASLYLWDKVLYPVIINQAEYLDSWIKFKGYRQRSWRTIKAPSTLAYEFQNLSWLYTIDNQIACPKDISLEMLHPAYSRHQQILSFLGIEKKEKSILELGGTEKQEEQRNLGEQLEHLARSKGMSIEELLQTIENIPNKTSEIVDVNSRPTNGDSKKKPENNETNEERPNFKTRLEKKWEEKENTEIHHPHTAPSTNSEFDVQENIANPPIEEQPLFSEQLTETSSDSGHKSNSKRTESALKSRNTEAAEEAEKAKEQLEIYDWFNQTPKFTFLWFKLLMELMHVDKGKQTPRQVEVDFSEWEFTCSDKVLHLENPNRPVPSWATEASFALSAIGETSHKLKGIIAKSDQKSLDIALDTDDNYEKYCADAKIIRVILENETNFIDSLDRRFIQLGFEDDYDMNENLPKNIEFIYGPPGTGKTTKLVKRLHNIVKNREKVNILVLTPTNKAADVIAEKMVDDDECYGCLTRFGATESLYLIEDAAVVTNRTDTDITLLEKNILVTTAARYAYDYLQPDDTFICDVDWDFIVIDEASMIDLLTITYVLYKGGNAEFIISGDPKQIPPVVQNNLPAYNIYDMVGLNDFAVAVNDYKRYIVTALKTQYRSVPVIGNAVSKFAYNGLLRNWDKRTAPKELKLDGIDISHFNFIGFDTAEFDSILELGAIGKSAFHLYSVIFTYNMVKYIANQVHNKYANTDYTIGVVCPYKAQASAIGQMLESNPIDTPNCHVSCGTVHGFQGDECDIMFVVMNPPANCSSESHVNEEYIINVGISRARDYLFILLPKGQPNGFYRKQQLGTLVSNTERTLLDCAQIEEVMFGQKNFIYSNTHVTCHMPVNVYCEENALYEVKIGDEAIDIKIRKE